ncbi:DUF1566 domain-containing protein [Marinospirillum sp.]|uniref:Lcl domain-containing protein n=1 Tax=Marinospirillum sp. TaxID=2183934 RepID=UPI003A879E36
MKKSILAIGLSTLFTTQAFAVCQQSTPTADFLRYTDGVVIHKPTGLMWQACSVGQAWNSATRACDMPSDLGDTRVTFEDALAYMEFDGDLDLEAIFGPIPPNHTGPTTLPNPLAAVSRLAGYDDWRIPNAREMLSLFETCATPSSNGNSYVNNVVFPNQFVDASSYQHDINRIDPDPSAPEVLRPYGIYSRDAAAVNTQASLYNNNAVKNFFFNTFLTSTLGGDRPGASSSSIVELIHVAHFHPISAEGNIPGAPGSATQYAPGQRLGTTSLVTYDYGYTGGQKSFRITPWGRANPLDLYEVACNAGSINDCEPLGSNANSQVVDLGFRLRPVRTAQPADYNRAGLIN